MKQACLYLVYKPIFRRATKPVVEVSRRSRPPNDYMCFPWLLKQTQEHSPHDGHFKAPPRQVPPTRLMASKSKFEYNNSKLILLGPFLLRPPQLSPPLNSAQAPRGQEEDEVDNTNPTSVKQYNVHPRLTLPQFKLALETVHALTILIRQTPKSDDVVLQLFDGDGRLV